MDELQISGKRFISSRRIARDNGYTSDYIGQLIRGGKVVGQKVGRAWYVDAVSFDTYLGEEGQVQIQPEKIPEPPALAPAPVVAEEQKAKIEEKVEEKKEESHYVPLHIVKAEVPAGLRYYSDDRPSLPEIREIRTETSEPWVAYPAEETKSIANDVFAPHAAHRVRPARIAGLAALGILVFVFSAVISSVMSLNLSIEEGNAASVSYGLRW